MRIYTLIRTDRVDYDEYASIVVVAPTEAKAREYFPKDGWKVDQSKIEAEYVGDAFPDVEEGILLSDFNAG